MIAWIISNISQSNENNTCPECGWFIGGYNVAIAESYDVAKAWAEEHMIGVPYAIEPEIVFPATPADFKFMTHYKAKKERERRRAYEKMVKKGEFPF